MISAAQQEALTRVGPGTPMGELLRRYWLPVAAECELRRRPAKRVRLLGEDLVLFRDGRGGLGLLDERCPHRGASLAYGCVEEDGIRCPYHGWKLDGAGSCLETPAEPPGSTLRQRVKARAYRAEALGGLVFAYLGPDPAPLLPRYDLFVWEGVLRDIGQALIPCNWLQIMENSVDPHHVEWLHGHHLAHVRGGGGGGGAKGGAEPVHYRRRHEKVGFDIFRHGIVKRRVLEGGSEEDDDWKIGHPLIFPVMLRVGAGGQHTFQVRVPVDDTHTWHLWYSCYRPADGAAVPVPPQDEVPLYEVRWRDEKGDFILDFVDGQDIMVWVTQGPVADRTRETLGSSDAGIALFRRLLVEQMEKVRRGEDPLGIVRDPAENGTIELPQEREKYRGGAGFLRESLELGHTRDSPIKDRIAEILTARGSARGRTPPGPG